MNPPSLLTTGPLYAVANWNAYYENNRSRTVRDLTWVPVPNKHDGEKYTLVMQQKHAAWLFSAWVLILQVASRCHPRGHLVRSDGTPYDAAGLALRTRAPVTWFALALPYFTESGWLVVVPPTAQAVAAAQQATDTPLPPACQAGDEEGKEENRKGKNRSFSESLCPSDLSEPMRSRTLRLNSIKAREPDVLWSPKELNAVRTAGLDTMADDVFTRQFDLIACYYATPATLLREHWRVGADEDFRRRELLTLLNNWAGEVDRAQAALYFLEKKAEAHAAERA